MSQVVQSLGNAIVRILYVCWLDPATTDYPLFLADAWSRLGNQVLLFPYDLEHTHRLSTKFWQAVGADTADVQTAVMTRRVDVACSAFRPEVILVGGTFIKRKRIEWLRERHHCIIGHMIGYNDLLVADHAQSLNLYDFIFVHDSYLLPVIKGNAYGKNPNVFWRPAVAEPLEHRPLLLTEQERERYGGDIVFIGGLSQNRVDLLKSLTRYDLRIWGSPKWNSIHELAGFFEEEPVYGLKKTKIYNSARIVLNVEDSEKQINALSERVPEVLACGGFVMTEWRADLGRSGLRDGESVVVFRSVDELVEKAEYYLAHPLERERISRRGREIVLDSLTYDHFAKEMAGQMESVLRQKAERQCSPQLW